MMALCLLAHAFIEEVSRALLECPLPIKRKGGGTMTKQYYLLLLGKPWLSSLVGSMQLRTGYEMEVLRRGRGFLPAFVSLLQAASALCEVLSVSICAQTVARFYPRLLMALLVQVHYAIGLSLPDTSIKQAPSLTLPPGCVVKTVKTLLLKMGCHYEFTSVEKEGGWELLTSSEEHHRGVGLLARAMVHYSCRELWRILYLLVPFLERGDKQHKLTAMAFFVELLHMPQAKRLPEKYSVIRLLKGLTDPDPVIRALCVRGLITMADWPGKVRWNPFHYTVDIRVITPEVKTQKGSGVAVLLPLLLRCCWRWCCLQSWAAGEQWLLARSPALKAEPPPAAAQK
uniref:Uncharacterized protein n=1 Tax=Chelydra serpentina TaxID=8475 RepID=A0A8C3TCQ8_CHESE